MPQHLLLENAGGVGKREDEGFLSFGRTGKEEKQSNPFMNHLGAFLHLISHLCPAFFFIEYLLTSASPPHIQGS